MRCQSQYSPIRAEKNKPDLSSSSSPPTPTTPLFLPSEDDMSTQPVSTPHTSKTSPGPSISPYRLLGHETPAHRSTTTLKQFHLLPLNARSGLTALTECLVQKGSPLHTKLDQSAPEFRKFIDSPRPRPSVVIPHSRLEGKGV